MGEREDDGGRTGEVRVIGASGKAAGSSQSSRT